MMPNLAHFFTSQCPKSTFHLRRSRFGENWKERIGQTGGFYANGHISFLYVGQKGVALCVLRLCENSRRMAGEGTGGRRIGFCDGKEQSGFGPQVRAQFHYSADSLSPLTPEGEVARRSISWPKGINLVVGNGFSAILLNAFLPRKFSLRKGQGHIFTWNKVDRKKKDGRR
jgi:hypothetical protein